MSDARRTFQCNGYNHNLNRICECGWGPRADFYSVDGTVDNGTSYPPPFCASMREMAYLRGQSLLFPTKCRYCSKPIFLFASPDGGFAIFDEAGKPWPKHNCTKAETARDTTKPELIPQLSSGDKATLAEIRELSRFKLFAIQHEIVPPFAEDRRLLASYTSALHRLGFFDEHKLRKLMNYKSPAGKAAVDALFDMATERRLLHERVQRLERDAPASAKATVIPVNLPIAGKNNIFRVHVGGSWELIDRSTWDRVQPFIRRFNPGSLNTSPWDELGTLCTTMLLLDKSGDLPTRFSISAQSVQQSDGTCTFRSFEFRTRDADGNRIIDTNGLEIIEYIGIVARVPPAMAVRICGSD